MPNLRLILIQTCDLLEILNKEISLETAIELVLFVMKKQIFTDGNNELKNRYLHIRWNEKVDIEQIKVDIEQIKVDINKNKVDIEKAKISKTIRKNIEILYQPLKDFEYFGRKEIIDVLKCRLLEFQNLFLNY